MTNPENMNAEYAVRREVDGEYKYLSRFDTWTRNLALVAWDNLAWAKSYIELAEDLNMNLTIVARYVTGPVEVEP